MTIILYMLTALMLALFACLCYLFFTEIFTLRFEETFYSEINKDYLTVDMVYTIPEAIEAKRNGNKLKLIGLF